MFRRYTALFSLVALFFLQLLAPQAVDASSYGRVQIDNSGRQTFAAASSYTAPAASTTDFWTIYGSSTKTIKVLRVEVAYTTSYTPAADKYFLIRRSTANSGGTSTLLTNVPLDSTNASGTAAVRIYTDNPSSLGTSVGNIATGRIISCSDAIGSWALIAASSGAIVVFDSKIAGQPIVLRGTEQGLCLNFNGVAPASTPSSIAVTVYWTEE